MRKAVKERPILFSGPMVRAICYGRKTQTRRVVKEVPTWLHLGRPIMDWPLSGVYQDGEGRFWLDVQTDVDDESHEELVCPYGPPGDRLWVREAFYIDSIDGEDGPVYYRADGECCQQIPECACAEVGKPHWKPSIHMPRRLCRIVLELTGVRIERLQEISEEDARAEGIRSDTLPACGDHPERICYVSEPDDNHAYETAAEAFQKSWDGVNAARGYSWASNPWVWALNFKVVESPSA